jgi:hypothetical protein
LSIFAVGGLACAMRPHNSQALRLNPDGAGPRSDYEVAAEFSSDHYRARITLLSDSAFDLVSAYSNSLKVDDARSALYHLWRNYHIGIVTVQNLTGEKLDLRPIELPVLIGGERLIPATRLPQRLRCWNTTGMIRNAGVVVTVAAVSAVTLGAAGGIDPRIFDLDATLSPRDPLLRGRYAPRPRVFSETHFTTHLLLDRSTNDIMTVAPRSRGSAMILYQRETPSEILPLRPGVCEIILR